MDYEYENKGHVTLGGRAFVRFPQAFVPANQTEDAAANPYACGNTGYCTSNGYNFCVGLTLVRGAYVPAVTVCQNLYLITDAA